MGEALRKRTPPERAEPEPAAAPPELTIEDVNVLLRSYQMQITQKSSEIASMAMELARRDRMIAALKAKLPK